MDFVRVEAEFQKLKGQYEAGALTEAEFKAQLDKLMLQDEQGRWWMIGYETGQWYYHDGKTWVRGEPPQVAARRREQVEALCREGAAALAAGDWGRATERFEAALVLEPGHADATARLAEARAQAQQVQESEAKAVIATRPMGALRRGPTPAYGRVAVLALLLLGFLGPWYSSNTFSAAGWRIFIDCFRGVFGSDFLGLLLRLTFMLVAVFFFVTLLRLIWRPAGESSRAIWLERIASGAALIGMGVTWLVAHTFFSSWGIPCTLAALLLAPVNLILERVTNRVRQQSGSTDSSADPGQRPDG